MKAQKRLEFHPEFIKKNNKIFAVLPMKEYERMQELMEDIQDLIFLREAVAKEKDAPTLSLEEVKKQLGIE